MIDTGGYNKRGDRKKKETGRKGVRELENLKCNVNYDIRGEDSAVKRGVRGSQ